MIDTGTVKEAVTVERLAEDMERELAELFPKQSDLRLQAVRLLMYLQESGPKKQGELVEEFGLEEYAMSRLLAKLELHRYIARRRGNRQDRQLARGPLGFCSRRRTAPRCSFTFRFLAAIMALWRSSVSGLSA